MSSEQTDPNNSLQIDLKQDIDSLNNENILIDNNSASSPHEMNSNLMEINNEPISSLNSDNASTSSSSLSNKKRKYECDLVDSNNNNHKKSNKNDDGFEVYLKLLIPASVAGGVIGRGGEKIAQIQRDANVRMKMSKANDYYPNTNERVCLIIGKIRSILQAYDLISERIRDRPELNSKGHLNEISEERVNQIKLLIPNTTAGLLIGKNGCFIKQIKEESGAFVQISPKQNDLPERIVCIEGDVDKRSIAFNLVVKKISDDPQHNSVPNLNYSVNSNDGNVSKNNSNGGGQAHNKFDFNSAANYLAGLNNLALLIINCGGSFQMTADSLRVTLRNAGYNASASKDIIDAITVLMTYNLITKVPTNGILSNMNNQGQINLGNMGGMMNNNINGNNYPTHHANQNNYPHHHQYSNNSSNNNNNNNSNSNNTPPSQSFPPTSQSSHHHYNNHQSYQIPPNSSYHYHHNHHHYNQSQMNGHNHNNVGLAVPNNLAKVNKK